MLTETEAKKYYEIGRVANQKYSNLRDAMREIDIPDYWHAQKAFDMGFSGVIWEVREYQRLGNLPSGASYNFMEQRPEKGVSVVTEEWMQTIHGMFFLEKNRNRKITIFKGVFTGFFGGDGEPLVLPVE